MAKIITERVMPIKTINGFAVGAKVALHSYAPKTVHALAGASKIAAPGHAIMLYLDGNLMLDGTVYLDGVVSTVDAPVKIVQGGVQ